MPHLSLSEVWGCSGTQLGSRTQGRSLAFVQRTACDCARGLAALSPHSWPHVRLHPPPSACSAFLHCKAHDDIVILTAYRVNLNFVYFLMCCTCTVPASSGDEGHGEARVNIIHTGGFLQRRLRAAPLFIRALVIVHHQLLHLHEALDDRNHPKVHLRHLQNSIITIKAWFTNSNINH